MNLKKNTIEFFNLYSIVSTKVIFTVIMILVVLFLLSRFFPKKEGYKVKVGRIKPSGGYIGGYGKYIFILIVVFVFFINNN